ncbi:MAG: sulfatase-like hydrolase/transferase [Thermoplasmatales archaeon]|nr:sulfatase-like hydrolase/transferase [Thermoplasmatales archaeon]
MNENDFDKKNIILLTVDCLRADHLGCMGNKKNVTPNIDALGKNGVIFKNINT